MQLLCVLVQILAVMEEFRQLTHDGIVHISPVQAKVRTYIVDDFLFVCFVVMQRQAEIIQLCLRQPLQNDLQSRRLLRDEQNLLSVS